MVILSWILCADTSFLVSQVWPGNPGYDTGFGGTSGPGIKDQESTSGNAAHILQDGSSSGARPLAPVPLFQITGDPHPSVSGE